MNLITNFVTKTNEITITEISNCWSLMDNALISLSNIEVLHNQCSNNKLQKMLKDVRDNLTTEIIQKMTTILKNVKVEPPSGFSRRDIENANYQKNDAMLTDSEIATTVLATLGGSLNFYYYAMLQSTNPSIGAIYLKFYDDTAKNASKLLLLAKESSWINIPPTLNKIKQ